MRVFGYVKPVKAELLMKEYDFYRATYCGICRAMKKHTGILSNATLTYDSVFLALVRMLYIPDEAFGAKMRRCIAHPLSRRPILDENEALVYTARAFAILTYYKLLDDKKDRDVGGRVAKIAIKPIVTHASSLAALPELESVVREKLEAIGVLEDAACQSVDQPADLFGQLLGEVFAYGLDGSDRLVTYRLGYHLGRFIYCADAAEDYERDRKAGSYNPYVLSYGGAPFTPEARSTVKCALLLECRFIESAVNLLPVENRDNIANVISNIIYLGLVKRIEFLDSDGSEQIHPKEKEN